jgi:hypothetical protein
MNEIPKGLLTFNDGVWMLTGFVLGIVLARMFRILFEVRYNQVQDFIRKMIES